MAAGHTFITGGAGFIGRWVVQRALQSGHDVSVYDNLQAGSINHIAEFSDQIRFYEADILDLPTLKEAMAEARPDRVIHLAALHFIPYCNNHPEETLRVNAEGTHAVLRVASEVGAQTAVVASSGALYPSRDVPLDEGIPPEPVDIYGLSKQLTEQIAEYFARTTNLACVAARLFNTYGPYETNPHLIPHIMESLHSGPSVELGNIHTKRDYIYVEDVAQLLFALAERPSKDYEVVNVGTGAEYSAEEIVQTLNKLLDRPIEIHVDQDRVRAVDKMHQRADTTRLERVAGASPTHDLKDGLRKLLRHEKLAADA